MKYRHILLAMASEIWAIEPLKLMAIIEFVSAQANGVKFTAAEIEARIAPQTAAAVARREGAVAVVPVCGVIANRMSLLTDISGGTSAEALTSAVNQLAADDGVKTVILDMNTPGGTVEGVEELAAAIGAAKASKPIVAQVNACCASAGYWLASAASEIVVTPSGRVGSIGVMSCYDDISKLLEIEGINREIIVSAPYKGELAGGLPMSDDARAFLQSQVDAYDAMFVNRVAAGRGVSAEIVRSQFGKGRMVMAQAAVDAGMADRVATMAETLSRFGVNPLVGAAPPPERQPFASAREKRALQIPR